MRGRCPLGRKGLYSNPEFYHESAFTCREEAGPTCSVPEDEARIAVGDALVIHDVIPNAACIGFTEIPIVSI